MTTVHHFKSNLRDMSFNLFEVLDIEHTTLAHERFQSLDRETVEAALAGLKQLAETTLAESFAAGDREGLSIDGDGNVTIPASVTKALKAYHDAEWHLLELPELERAGRLPHGLRRRGLFLRGGKRRHALRRRGQLHRRRYL